MKMKMDNKQLLQNDCIGEILLKFNKVTKAGIEQVVRLQKEEGLYFGEAVVKLGLAGKEDVDLAVAYQFAHPYLGKGENTISKEIIAAYIPFDPRVEAVRSVRTALLLSGAGLSLKSVCVAGCRKGDGRTFLATNLAVVFAQLGHKTLLMDFNLRDPKIHKLFQLKNSCGVSTLLINRSTVEETVQTTPFEKLDVLPSGPLPPNPLELIARPGARQLMETLKGAYEIIIVSAPSFERAADVCSLASIMDGVFIVALQGKTRKDELGKAKSVLDGAGARLLGIVLNQR